MKRHIFGMAVALVLWGAPAAWAYDWQQNGERLHYNVYFGFLKAGEAELLYEPQTFGTENEQGQGYQIVARAWADSFLFKLLERLSVVGGHTPTAAFLPADYRQMQLENDFKADKQVVFDHALATATYTNHRSREVPQKIDVPAGTRDMLSALYYLRRAVPKLEGDIPALPVVSLHRMYRMDIRLGKVESMKTKEGKIFLQEVIPVLTAEDGSGKVSDDWRIWVTTDARRLPVRIALKSRFGTFKAELDGYGDAATASHAPSVLAETGRFID